MAGKPATLAVKITGDPDDAVSAFDKVTASARDMGDTVDHASRQVEDGSTKLDRATESADNLGSKSGELTGAIGALSSGFALVGAEKYAAQLESAAMATDFLSGVGDLARLALESQALATARARVASVAHAVASKAQAAATFVMAGAQRALNLAMRANPIGIVITLILAVIGALVLAYRHSDRFRAIVDRAGAVAKAAFGRVVNAVQAVVGWLRDKLGPAVSFVVQLWPRIRDAAARAFDAVRDKVGNVVSFTVNLWPRIRDAAARAFDAVRDKVAAVVGSVTDRAALIRDRFASVWTQVRDAAGRALDAIIAPVQRIIDLVQSLLDKIGSIHIPRIHIPGVGRIIAPGGFDPGTGGASPAVPPVVVQVSGYVGDEAQLADVIARALDKRARRMGLV